MRIFVVKHFSPGVPPGRYLSQNVDPNDPVPRPAKTTKIDLDKMWPILRFSYYNLCRNFSNKKSNTRLTLIAPF